jgi:hypothetical protein
MQPACCSKRGPPHKVASPALPSPGWSV